MSDPFMDALQEAAEQERKRERTPTEKALAAIVLPVSMLRHDQKRKFRQDFVENGEPGTLIAEVRHDDECHNGHNTFAITGEMYGPGRSPGETRIIHKPSKKVLWMHSCGCLHDDIAKHMPELAPYLRWHLCSTDGPMHYLANASWWHSAEQSVNRMLEELRQKGDVDALKQCEKETRNLESTIIYGAVPGDDAKHPWFMPKEEFEAWLVARFAALMQAFKRDVEALGLQY